MPVLIHPAEERQTSANCSPRSVCQRISDYAGRMPSKLAITHGGGTLTYAELDMQSSRIAANLRQRGLGRECCVALLLDRSPRFVIAALAVLKTGAAYLPLDVATPPEGLAYILNDAAVAMLVTEKPQDCHCAVTDFASLVAARPDIRRQDNDAISPDSLAYVIYTSGSTGRPKGVEITHANLLNLIDWHQEAFGVTDSDHASQIAGLGFDAAVWEIWPTLTAGACLHIADEKTRRSPRALQDFLLAEKITISFAPTLLAEQLLAMTWPAETAVRVLLTGADTLNRRPAAGLPFALVNNYGPTECTVVATSGVVASEGGEGPPSIGRPIRNATVAILDGDQRPVPPGEPGELCIAGALVGRGYRNAPTLTPERFICASITPGGDPVRIYRTGDRARLLPGGEIAFLGRLDEQVKIRGYRVELGGIAACLNRCPDIECCAVRAHTSASVPVLVAYVVLASDSKNKDLTASDLREFLARRLPEYMIPASFVSVAALPVTTNGKLDRSALPEPSQDNMLRDRAAPVSTPLPAPSPSTSDSTPAVERQLAELVASLLGLSTIEVTQDIFLAGGHSMFGAQLLSRMRDAFGIRLTLRQLFSTPTVAGLAAEIEWQTKNRR
jgi:amino acid adenylation domain-containing protein